MKKLSDRERNCMFSDYKKGFNTYQLAQKYKISQTAIYGLLKRYGISLRNMSQAKRVYEFNEKAFDKLNSESSYWLGFIYADGYIHKKRNNLVIRVRKQDKLLLEKFNEFLKSSYPIKQINNNGYPAVQISIKSKHLIERLYNLGLHSPKSLNLKFPLFLDEEFYSDFIRGYFDGDGSISISKKHPSNISFTITSAEQFILEVQKILTKECQLNKTKLQKYPNTSIVSMRYCGKKQIKRIKRYLIRNGGFYLPRKLGVIDD